MMHQPGVGSGAARRTKRSVFGRQGSFYPVSAIYHIATRCDWERARRAGEYTTSTIGKTLADEGFIHASGPGQVADVANTFYRDVADALVVLVIDPRRVRAGIRYEHVPGAASPFPHIYGPLNTDAVIAERPLRAGPDGEFTFSAEP